MDGSIWFSCRFGRKIVVVTGLIVGAIGNMLVTVFPDEPDNKGNARGATKFSRRRRSQAAQLLFKNL